MANEFAEQIREAVALLEPATPEHWTQGGRPSVGAVRELVGDPSVTRADIDAACPGAGRDATAKAKTNVSGGGTDVAKKPQDGDQTAPETSDETQQGSQNASTKNPADGNRRNSSDDAAGKTGEQDVREPELSDDDADTVLLRGVCLAIILGLPDAYLTVGVAPLVDEMADYLGGIDSDLDRQVAIECIRSIARNRPAEIPAGAYKARIEQGMQVVTGLREYMAKEMLTPAEEQAAAHARMSGVVTKQPTPDNSEPPASDAQKEAADRLANL